MSSSALLTRSSTSTSHPRSGCTRHIYTQTDHYAAAPIRPIGRRHYAMMTVVCPSVYPSVCPVTPVPYPNSRTEGCKKLECGSREAQDTGTFDLHLEVKRSKVKVTKLFIACYTRNNDVTSNFATPAFPTENSMWAPSPGKILCFTITNIQKICPVSPKVTSYKTGHCSAL